MNTPRASRRTLAGSPCSLVPSLQYDRGAMAIRKIASIGHPVLRQRSRSISREELASPAIQTFIDDLIDTMRDAHGAGLAANQVHEAVRICAIEVVDNPRYPYKPNIPLTVLVNPE